MKHFRILLPVLILALMLSGCGKQSREPYTYSYSTFSGDKTITVNPETQTILDGTDVYDYEVESTNIRTSYVITYPNGATYHWTASEHGGAGGWSDDYDENRYISGNILIHAIEQNQPREKTGNVGIGFLLMGLGALNFFFPELPFYLKYGWAVENAEPSDTYITITKIGGVAVMIVGLIWCFI